MAEQAGPGFAALLRQLRADSGLTQGELAEAASLSPRSVSDLERGVHRSAHKDTALLLAMPLASPSRPGRPACEHGHAPGLALRRCSVCRELFCRRCRAVCCG